MTFLRLRARPRSLFWNSSRRRMEFANYLGDNGDSLLPSSGIISLLSDFSIGCVLEGGRVSLAHLIEFAHFIDLYVLEDVIYLNSSSRQVSLEALAPYEDCPFKELPDNRLSLTISYISDNTREIYDCAKVNCSFSMDGYDYWLRLSDEEKAKIPRCYPPEGIRYFSRDYLLFASRELTEHIDFALEELAKTRLTLMPSPRNLLPFLEGFQQVETPAQLVYGRLTASQRQLVDDVQSLIRPRTVYLPPLLSILLKRCESAADIIPRLRELRFEYADFRRDVAEWFRTLDEASTIREKIQIREGLERSIHAVVEKLHSDRLGFYKELAGTAIEAAGEGELKKALMKPAFALLKKGVIAVAPDYLAAKRFTGLVGLMNEALEVNGYGPLLRRVFGDRLDVSQREITDAKKYRKEIISRYGFDCPVPS